MNPIKLRRAAQRALPLTVATLLAALFVSPLYVSFIYSVKTKSQITFTGLAFPTEFHFENFSRAIEVCHFYRALFNSLATTVPTVLILTVICPMAAYVLGRNQGKFYTVVYTVLLVGLLVPYQTVLLPEYANLKAVGLLNTYFGNVLVKVGFQISTSILMFTGFIKGVPRELEEAGYIDGLGKSGAFWRIVFPMLKPVVYSSVILNALFSWNDFQIALVTLTRETLQTLPQALYGFFGKHSTELNLAFAAFTLAMIPLIALYLVFQKNITSGLMAGAVKG